MRSRSKALSESPVTALNWPLRLTRVGMIAERVANAFWPFWSLIFLALAALMFGLQDDATIEIVWIVAGVTGLCLIVSLVFGLRRFRMPTRADARVRLDSTLPNRPIETLNDQQAIGSDDPAAQAVWTAHQDRMAIIAASAKAPSPDLRLSRKDPYALRYVALLAFCVALLFGSILRVASIADIAPQGRGVAATGPSWEGWIEPPAYTGLPSLYLNDLADTRLTIPENSLVTVRLYGEVGSLSVTETVSKEGRQSLTQSEQSFDVTTGGQLLIDGADNAEWVIVLIPDVAPSVSLDGDMEISASGEIRQPFKVLDDYGIVAGTATLELELGQVDRRYGLTVEPDPRDPVVLDLPLTISGDRGDFTDILVDNFSRHPWAGLPVTLTLSVEDSAGQIGQSDALTLPMPGRRFFDPLAGAVIEARRDLLWAKENGARTAQVLRTATHRPDGFIQSSSAYLMLRVVIRRIEAGVEFGMPDDSRDEIADALWDIALLLEDGHLSDALERMRQAQDRLSQAMRDGASDQEIQQLMDELREATENYMRQLAQNPEQNGEQSAGNQNMQQMSQQDLQDMMDRIQELMEQGRMAEAQELLDQLSQMMENMQVTEGGEGQQGPGEQSMEELSETLRNQQGLSDDAFRDLQEQFNPNAQAGESQENEGRNGGEGRGQSHEGQRGSGQGADGDQQGERGTGGERDQSLADRQQALRDELDRQSDRLPGTTTPEGEAAAGALDRAGEAMDKAEQALRDNDFAEALENQADAMEELREGMRQLGEMVAQSQQNQGQQGRSDGQFSDSNRDPLGRRPGARGPLGTDEGLLQGEDVYRRAKELLDLLRERSSDRTRTKQELEYLKRLLERF